VCELWQCLKDYFDANASEVYKLHTSIHHLSTSGSADDDNDCIIMTLQETFLTTRLLNFESNSKEKLPGILIYFYGMFNPLNAELNPIRHLLALVGARHFVHVSRIRVNV
jgi:hypothetical protein